MIVGLKVPINHNVNIIEHHCPIKYVLELSINHHLNQFKQATHSDEHNKNVLETWINIPFIFH